MLEQYQMFSTPKANVFNKREKENIFGGEKVRAVSEADAKVAPESIPNYYDKDGRPVTKEGAAAAKSVYYPNTNKTHFYIRVHGGGFRQTNVYDPPTDGESISLTAKYGNDQPHFPFKEVRGDVFDVYVRYLTDRKAALLATVNRSFAQN